MIPQKGAHPGCTNACQLPEAADGTIGTLRVPQVFQMVYQGALEDHYAPLRKDLCPFLATSRREGPGRVPGCLPFLPSCPASPALGGLGLGGRGDGVSGLPPDAEPSSRRSCCRFSACAVVLQALPVLRDKPGEGTWQGWRNRGWGESKSRRETKVPALAAQLKDHSIPAVTLRF